MSNDEMFTDQASILALMAGLAAYAVTADPSKQQEIFGEGSKTEKTASQEAKEAAEEMEKAAKENNSGGFLKAYVRLPKNLRHNLHGVAKKIKSGAATVQQYADGLNRVRKGFAFSLKRSITSTIYKELAKNKLTYIGKPFKFTTPRGKQVVFRQNTAFAIAKSKKGGYTIQTYYPLSMNKVSEEIGERLQKFSKPRTSNKKDKAIQPYRRPKKAV